MRFERTELDGDASWRRGRRADADASARARRLLAAACGARCRGGDLTGEARDARGHAGADDVRGAAGRARVRAPTSDAPPTTYVLAACFDGHRGPAASEYAARALPGAVRDAIEAGEPSPSPPRGAVWWRATRQRATRMARARPLPSSRVTAGARLSIVATAGPSSEPKRRRAASVGASGGGGRDAGAATRGHRPPSSRSPHGTTRRTTRRKSRASRSCRWRRPVQCGGHPTRGGRERQRHVAGRRRARPRRDGVARRPDRRRRRRASHAARRIAPLPRPRLRRCVGAARRVGGARSHLGGGRHWRSASGRRRRRRADHGTDVRAQRSERVAWGGGRGAGGGGERAADRGVARARARTTRAEPTTRAASCCSWAPARRAPTRRRLPPRPRREAGGVASALSAITPLRTDRQAHSTERKATHAATPAATSRTRAPQHTQHPLLSARFTTMQLNLGPRHRQPRLQGGVVTATPRRSRRFWRASPPTRRPRRSCANI